jgi:hypothetical protein
VEALKKKERMKLSLSPKLMGWNSGFSWNLTLCMTKLRVPMLCFPYFTDNCNISAGWVFGGDRGCACCVHLPYLKSKGSKLSLAMSGPSLATLVLARARTFPFALCFHSRTQTPLRPCAGIVVS